MKSSTVVFGIGLLVAITACSVAPDDGDVTGAVTVGDASEVRFEVAFRGPPSEGENELVLVPIRVSDGARMPMAHVHVLPPEMPAMGHISTVRPEVHEETPGEYAVGDIIVTMPGIWRLHVEIDSPSASDTATIELEVH